MLINSAYRRESLATLREIPTRNVVNEGCFFGELYWLQLTPLSYLHILFNKA